MQVYVIVFQGKNVLVAKKNVVGTRFHGIDVPNPSVLNYAGQWVFPGGGVKTGQTAEKAARVEFFEETGHRLRWDVKSSKMITPDNNHGILFVESNNIATIADTINGNIYGNKPADNELELVQVVDFNSAISSFSNWINQDDQVETTLFQRSGKWYKDRSWFINALRSFYSQI